MRTCIVSGLIWFLSFMASAAPVTDDRVASLPAAARTAWGEYLSRSAALASRDRDALAAELASAGLAAARRPPAGEDFKVPPGSDATWYAGPEAAALADAVLSYQSPAGGWSKHLDYAAGIRRPGTQWTSQSEPGKPSRYLATFDNGATTGEIAFLARLAAATGRDDCQAAVDRGLRFVLAAQYPNGGWPQVYPLQGGYHDAITFNDGVMVDVLELLESVASGGPPHTGVDAALRQQAMDALHRGVACVLATQVGAQGRKTGWCQQYDAVTLEPASARAYEPAALDGLETAQVLRWLMKLPDPDADLAASILAGVEWLESARVEGLRKTKVRGRTAYVEDASSGEVYWARFYDLRTGRPIFPGRDGVVYDTYEAMARRNRVGYDYLSDRPRSVITNGANTWRKKHVP